MATTNLYLRDSLDHNQHARNNLAAFCPDIVPLHQFEALSVGQLTLSYDHFIAVTVVPEEVNNVYLRGTVPDPTNVGNGKFTVMNVTNEIILWPQVLKAATQIGVANLTYSPGPGAGALPGVNGSTKAQISIPDVVPGVTASLTNLTFKPENKGGRHDVLLAYRGGAPFTSLPDAKNFAELIKSVGVSDDFAFLNARIADPVFDVYTWSTRLRFFDDSGAPIKLELDIETIGLPSGFEVSIFSSDPNITLPSTPLVSGKRIGISVPVIDKYDSLVTIQITHPAPSDPSFVPSDNASVSLVASVQDPSNSSVFDILGAEHVVFNSSIRLAKHLSPSNAVVLSKAAAITGSVSGSITLNIPGFYFRDTIGDKNVFPRKRNTGSSPDIQPYGTTPDPNFATDFTAANYDTDISTKRGSAANLVAQSANYIYVRGNSDMSTDVEIALYAIPNSLLICPTTYKDYQMKDVNTDGKTTLATRRLTFPAAGPQTCNDPFNNYSPIDPKYYGSDHYCYVVEARPWVDAPLLRPPWPHQMNLATGADITGWILGSSCVATRNVCWVPNPDTSTQIWQCNATIPDGFPATTKWCLQLVCGNMPINGYCAMSATGSPGIFIDKTQISNPNMSIGVNFTGIKGPLSMTVTMSWWQGNGTPIDTKANSSMTTELQIITPYNGALAMMAFGKERSAESTLFPFIVGPDYPNLKSVKDIQTNDSAKGDMLLDKAHPIKEIAKPGRYQNSHVVSAATTLELAVVIGADRRLYGQPT